MRWKFSDIEGKIGHFLFENSEERVSEDLDGQGLEFSKSVFGMA